MAKIEDLPIKSISEMTDEELDAHLLNIRANRRSGGTTSKEKKVKTSRAATDSLQTLLNAMSPEERLAFLQNNL